MQPNDIEALWQKDNTAAKLGASNMTMLTFTPEGSHEHEILRALETIGVLEVRRNGKVNVPDIFRVEAGIKRKGGVKVPNKTRPYRESSH